MDPREIEMLRQMFMASGAQGSAPYSPYDNPQSSNEMALQHMLGGPQQLEMAGPSGALGATPYAAYDNPQSSVTEGQQYAATPISLPEDAMAKKKKKDDNPLASMLLSQATGDAGRAIGELIDKMLGNEASPAIQPIARSFNPALKVVV